MSHKIKAVSIPIIKDVRYIQFEPKVHAVLGSNQSDLAEFKKPEQKDRKNTSMKLFVSVVQFLNYYYDPKVHVKPILIASDACPGLHFSVISKIYPDFEYHLYGRKFKFHRHLENLRNVVCHERAFTMDEFKKLSTTNRPVFFVSDLHKDFYYENDDNKSDSFDRSVKETIRVMKEQMDIYLALKPTKALLMLDFPENMASFEYLAGTVFHQAFQTNASYKTRLVPHDNGNLVKWDLNFYRKSLNHHHQKIRGSIDKNESGLFFYHPQSLEEKPVSYTYKYGNDYDATLLCQVITDYIQRFYLRTSPDVTALIEKIITLLN